MRGSLLSNNLRILFLILLQPFNSPMPSVRKMVKRTLIMLQDLQQDFYR